MLFTVGVSQLAKAEEDLETICCLLVAVPELFKIIEDLLDQQIVPDDLLSERIKRIENMYI